MADDRETESAGSRYWLTNDALAFFIVIAFVGYVYAPLSPWIAGYPETNAGVLAAFITAFGVAVAWAFGKDAVEAWRGNSED